MFSLKIIDTDEFLDMPATTQNLYFHLGMRADDDGFIASPKKITKMINSADDDMKVLITKKFIIPFENGVCVIRHWRIHNYIQKDRYEETQYLEEKASLSIKNNKYTTNKLKCIQNVSKMFPQDRVGKVRKGKDRIGKDRIGKVKISSSESEDSHKKLIDLLDDPIPTGKDNQTAPAKESEQSSSSEPISSFSIGNVPKEKNSAKRESEAESKPPRKDADIIAVIDGSADWNSAMYQSWYKNATQRKAIEKLLLLPEINGLDGLLGVISIMPQICSQPYAPKITSPWELLSNWARIKIYLKQQKTLSGKGEAGKVSNLQEFLENN